ncbi:unnamed protein product [Discosporangium mesarthrocarpum]
MHLINLVPQKMYPVPPLTSQRHGALFSALEITSVPWSPPLPSQLAAHYEGGRLVPVGSRSVLGWLSLSNLMGMDVHVRIVSPNPYPPLLSPPLPSQNDHLCLVGGRVEPDSELTPVLLVLNKVVLSREAARGAVKEAIFPPKADRVWQERLERERAEISTLRGEEREKAERARKDREIHPVDAPRGTLRARLLSLMTANVGSLKRAASELLYSLCSSEEEFTIRCGFGNAINLLRIKGLVGVQGV